MADVIGGSTAALLCQIVARIEREEEEKAKIADGIKAIYAEAKAHGFDTKAIRRQIRRRKKSKEQVEEEEALDDIYRAALGDLGDTPLGEAAVRRLSKEAKKAEPQKPETKGGKKPPADPPPPAAPSTDDPAEPDTDGQREQPQQQDGDTPPADPPKPSPTVADAQRMGAEAAKAGQPITSNPFVARDPRRAAWDMGWCQAAGSDGMDIPDAFKPTAKKSKGEDGHAEGCSDGDKAASPEGSPSGAADGAAEGPRENDENHNDEGKPE